MVRFRGLNALLLQCAPRTFKNHSLFKMIENPANIKQPFDKIWACRIHTLLTHSLPHLLTTNNSIFTDEVAVASKLQSSNSLMDKYSTVITDSANDQYSFAIDPYTKNYQSKGNWLWTTNLEIFYLEDSILSINIKKVLIDIPYSGKSVNAYWLLKNFEKEIHEQLTFIEKTYF